MNKTTYNVLLATGFYFFLKLIFLHSHPIYLDECLYIEMAEEQWENFSFVPTYFGFEISSKPPLFFWIYAPIIKLLQSFFTDIELIYKLPNLILGALNGWLVFVIFRRISNEKIAFYTFLLYSSCALIIYSDLRVLIDTLNTLFILASLYFYLTGVEKKNIMLGMIFAFFAAITKTVLAFLIPIVIFVHFWKNKDEGKGLNIQVLASFVAVPLGILLHYIILAHYTPHLTSQAFIYDILGKLFGDVNYLNSIGLSYINIITFMHALFIFAILGLIVFWKENPGLTIWAILVILSFIGSYGMVWYFYPFIPVLAYFSVKALSTDIASKKEKYDILFKLVIGIILVFNIIILYLWYEVMEKGLLRVEYNMGLFLAGKENVVFIGDYQPTITAITYKTLEERMHYKKYLDFGWIILTRNETIENQIKMAGIFALNYTTNKYPVNEDNFARLFTKQEMFRKPTNITKADYLMIGLVNINATNWTNNITINGYKQIMGGAGSVLMQRIS